MAQQGGDEGLTEKLGGMSLESVSGGTSKPPVGPAGLIHKDSDAIKLFVGQIPKHMDEEKLRPVFDEFGEIFDLAVIRDKISGVHRGCAFLTYCARSSADAAIAALHGQRKLDRGQNPLQVRPAEGQAEQENKLFVGMAPKSATEEDIRAVFEPYGTLREIHVIRNQDGTNKGCAFVKYTTRQSALEAIECLHNQHTMQGGPRPLVVKFADNKRGSQGATAAARLVGSVGSPDRHGSDGWLRHVPPVQGGGYPYSTPQQSYPPLMMGSSPYVPYGGAHATGSQSNYLYYPYGPPRFQPSAAVGGAPGLYPSAGPPSPARGGGAGFGGSGQGQARSRIESEARLRTRGVDDNSEDVAGGVGTSRPTRGPPGANLFIYHLPQGVSDADLATAFQPFGEVLSSKVFIDRESGESKGFGFVSYDKPRDAELAISKMNGFQIGSKRLKVQPKRCGETVDLSEECAAVDGAGVGAEAGAGAGAGPGPGPGPGGEYYKESQEYHMRRQDARMPVSTFVDDRFTPP